MVRESLRQDFVMFIKSMLKNKRNFELLLQIWTVWSYFEGHPRDDIFILIQYIAYLWYRLFVMPNKWKFVDFPLLLTVLLVKIKIFEVRFFQRLCSILTVGFQSFTNDAINFRIDFSLNYKNSSKTLEFKFEPLPLLETSCYLGKMLSCIYFISSQSLKPRPWVG